MIWYDMICYNLHDVALCAVFRQWLRWWRRDTTSTVCGQWWTHCIQLDGLWVQLTSSWHEPCLCINQRTLRRRTAMVYIVVEPCMLVINTIIVGEHHNHRNGCYKITVGTANLYKKAELSQRWLRDAPYIWVLWKFSRVPDCAHDYYYRNF